MKKAIGLIGFIIMFLCVYSQEQKQVYFESAGDKLVRFYFDENYYLVDKHCEFKSIERLAAFDGSTNKYIGSFTDFDLTGHPILEGNYANGERSGLFKAYHPNGSIKWECNFSNNLPSGEWRYYYPDSKLMMVVLFSPETARIMEFYDTRGRAVVHQGNGRFEFRVPVQGYNPYGYPFVKQKGKLKEGVPEGYWQIYYEADKISDLIAEEMYSKGVFKSGVDLINEREYESPTFSLLPVEKFFRAERFISKSCNYDEIAGYIDYLMDQLSEPFISYEPKEAIDDEFEYKVQVSKEGSPSKLEVIDDVPKEISRPFKYILTTIERYIPSFVNGEYIEDELHIKGKVALNAEGKIYFHSISIQRKNEQ
ncbi:toxin-antitoxin system YwqK family antitoxin [Sphingobacterium daejeonense]|uniref:toxin-antitoxin system YwqK family antitoxin n=1 Tax=Sphingobacterium daejeonense TaxID=371142 RepID=UPI003D321F8B